MHYCRRRVLLQDWSSWPSGRHMARCSTAGSLPATLARQWAGVDKPVSQQTQNISMTFIQRRPNVGPTLYKCYTNVLCLLGYCCRDLFLLRRSAAGSVVFLHAVLLSPCWWQWWQQIRDTVLTSRCACSLWSVRWSPGMCLFNITFRRSARFDKCNKMNDVLGHLCAHVGCMGQKTNRVEPDDTALQTHNSKFKSWRFEAQHTTFRFRRLSQY